MTGKVNDVEFFLHEKAISYESMTLSTTYLIFASAGDENVLVGYFSLANKPLVMNKKNYKGLAKISNVDCARMDLKQSQVDIE